MTSDGEGAVSFGIGSKLSSLDLIFLLMDGDTYQYCRVEWRSVEELKIGNTLLSSGCLPLCSELLGVT